MLLFGLATRGAALVYLGQQLFLALVYSRVTVGCSSNPTSTCR